MKINVTRELCLHPINELLSRFGLEIRRTPERRATSEFMANYKRNLDQLKKNLGDLTFLESFVIMFELTQKVI